MVIQMVRIEELYDLAIQSIEESYGRKLSDSEKNLVKIAFHLGLVERSDSSGKTSTPYGVEWSE